MVPKASKKVIEKIKEQSEKLLELGEKKFGIKLDYSEEALAIADDLITIFFKVRRSHYIKAIVMIGSYLGEVIIKNLGGKWLKDLSIKKVGKMKGFAHPMTRARKRLSIGMDASLVYYYKNLKLTTCGDSSFATDREKYEKYRQILLDGGWDKVLLERIKNEEEPRYVREESAELLGRLAKENIGKDLVEMAKNPKLVYYAAIALQGLPVKEAYEPLIDNLKKVDDLPTLQQIILALGKIGNPDAIDHLIGFLADQDEIVGYYAALAIGEIGTDKALDELLAIMAGLREGKREHAITALEIIGDKRAVPALIEALFSRDEEIREAAARALQYIPDERAFKPLAYCLKDPSSRIRILAAYAIANIDKEETIPLIKELLKDDVQNVRLHATHLLNWLKEGKKPQAKVI